MTTYPLSTLTCSITSAGITAPTYQDIFESFKAIYRGIYGADTYLEPDSQDGQWIAAQSKAQHETNQAMIAVYNSFSPATAMGEGLSSVVKINGLARQSSSQSTAQVTIVGQPGTIITNGIVGDNQGLGTQWTLPASVTIPIGGSITVTAKCTQQGTIVAGAASLTRIVTPTLGWQTVTNAAAATLGNPVEPDGQLRKRQASSTAIPSLSVADGIFGAVANLTGVGRCALYENDTGSTDANGIPAHKIAVVVEGGDATTIAQTIARKKTPGTGTAGTTSITVVDDVGVPSTISFYPLTEVPLTVTITIKALPGYVSTTGTKITAAVLSLVNGLAIGEDSYLTRLTAAASLLDDPLHSTFYVTAAAQSRSGSPTAADVTIAFQEAATLSSANLTLTVT